MPDATVFARARALAERLMEDSCVITRDPEFLADSSFNEVTGQLTAPAPGPTQIYSGKCTIAASAGINQDEEGGAPIVRRPYQATIPVDAPAVTIGDLLTVTDSAQDALLTSKAFVVAAVAYSTHAFRRRLWLDLSVRADAQ